MNRFRKLADGSWGIVTDAPDMAGQTVTVNKANGSTTTETLGDMIYGTGGSYAYAIATVRETPAAVPVGDMTGVQRLFDVATASRLRHPAIVLHVIGLGEIRLSRAGASAKVPGSINVATNEGFNDRTWFGRILRAGTFEPSPRRDLPAGLTDALVAFASDPARVAADHGRRTGRCFACQSKLDDERSTAVGYGPVCAKKWGLPFGVKAARAANFAAEAAVAA